jgi:fructoselysine-6-P-deglycase FrlB-like protein
MQMIPDMLAQCLGNNMQRQIEKVIDEIQGRKIEKIFLLGRGSSYFATLSLRYLFSAILDIPVSTCSYPMCGCSKHEL